MIFGALLGQLPGLIIWGLNLDHSETRNSPDTSSRFPPAIVNTIFLSYLQPRLPSLYLVTIASERSSAVSSHDLPPCHQVEDSNSVHPYTSCFSTKQAWRSLRNPHYRFTTPIWPPIHLHISLRSQETQSLTQHCRGTIVNTTSTAIITSLDLQPSVPLVLLL